MKKQQRIQMTFAALAGVALILTVIALCARDNYIVLVMNTALVYAMVAYGLSVILGMGGQLVFSGVAFMGIGAYSVGNLCSGRLGFTLGSFLAILIAIGITAAISFFIGVLFMRLKNSFCTFATLGFVQVLWSLFQNYTPAFGGPNGIPQIATLSLFGKQISSYQEWFYLLLVAVLLIAIIVERIRSSRFGRALAAVRDNEIAAMSLGINIYWTRVIAFVIAGVFAGFAGALIAMHNRFISGDMFRSVYKELHADRETGC